MNTVGLTVHPWIIRLFCTYAFLLPFSSWLASIVLAPLLILCFIYRISEKNLFRFSSFIMLLMMLFYIVHLTGLINTSNFSYAGLDLQIKVSFLLMPLFIDMIPVSTTDYRRITRTFLAGCTLFSLVLVVNAILEFFIWHDRKSFFYIDFSSQQHVAYLTLYINCALFFLADEIYRLPGYRLRNRYLLILWMFFLFVITILLASRTAELALLVSLPFYIYHLTRMTGGKIKSLLLAGCSAVTMIILFLLVSGTNNRFEEKPAAVVSNVPAPSTSGVQHNVRFEIWKNVLQVYSQSVVFGVGTGDIKDELNAQYRKNNFNEGLEYNLSPHNQFLHTLLTLGIPGLLILIMLFLKSAIRAWDKRNYIVIALLIAVVVNCLTEGILEKQAGVLFFVFFMIILKGQEKNFSVLQKAEA